MLIRADKSIKTLDENGGLPVGVDGNFQYQIGTVSLAPGERVLVFSDGLVEQCSEGSTDGQRRDFGQDGVRAVVEGCQGDDLLKELFAALKQFAGGEELFR